MAVSKKEKNDLKWVVSALPKDEEEKDHFQKLWVVTGKPNWLCATNGHRIHAIKTKFRSGYFLPTVDGIKKDSNEFFPPSLDNYFPLDFSMYNLCELNFGDIQRSVPEHIDMNFRPERCCKVGDRVYNYRYILDVYLLSNSMFFFFNDTIDAGIFLSLDKSRCAIVMPLVKDSYFEGVEK